MRKYILILAMAVFACSCQRKANHNFAKMDSTATSATNAGEVTGDNFITPGKSMGKIFIDENAANVFSLLGKPDAGDAAMGKSLSTWYQDHNAAGYQTQVFFSRQVGANDDISRVKQIRVTSPEYKTGDSIHVQTLFKDIKASGQFKLNKVAMYNEGGKAFILYADVSKGIAFETGEDEKCSGIIVFEPGHILSYFPFHAKMQILKK
jgi:hypothetical protein